MNTKKSGNWLKDNIMGIVIAALIGIIIWGGQRFMTNQEEINQQQQQLNLEFTGSSAETCIKVDQNTGSIEKLEENDSRQDEILIRHENEIINLKQR